MNESNNRLNNYIQLLKKHEVKMKERKRPDENSKIYKVLFITLLTLVILSFLFIGIYALVRPNYRFLVYTSVTLIFLSYILFIFMPVSKIYKERKVIKYFFVMPLSSSIDLNIKTESFIDNEFLPELISLGKDTLEMGLMEIKHEREFLNKRITLLVGPIDKLGILPGIISMIIAISKPAGMYDWVMGLAYGYIALIIISLSFFDLLVKYDRVIALTELALSRCVSED